MSRGRHAKEQEDRDANGYAIAAAILTITITVAAFWIFCWAILLFFGAT